MLRHLALFFIAPLFTQLSAIRLQPVSLAVLVLVAGTVACRQNSEPQSFSTRGVVKQVAPEDNRVLIAHEDIPGFMPAMTMEFEVKTPEMLLGLSPGDAITLTLEQTPDSLYLVAIEEPVGGKSGEAALQEDQGLTARHAQSQETNAAEPQAERAEFVPFPAPDFLLTDQDGQTFVLSHLRGKVILMDFIFTQCPGPCPMLSTKFSHLQRRLGKRLGKEVMLVSVSIDPQRDTPSVLQVYARRYKADLSGWKFLTGTTRAILTVATQYGAEYLGGSEGVRDHRLLTCVIDQEGTLVQEFTGVNHTVDELMAVVEALLA